MKKFQTPIKRARGLGSSHSGSHHFIAQRVSAIALLFLSLWFVLSLALTARWDYEHFLAYWAFPLHCILAVLTIISALYHAVLGVQVICEDYIHHHGWRLFALLSVKFMAVLLASFIVYGGILLTNWN